MEEVKEYSIIREYCGGYPHLISTISRHGLIHIDSYGIKFTESLGLFPKRQPLIISISHKDITKIGIVNREGTSLIIGIFPLKWADELLAVSYIDTTYYEPEHEQTRYFKVHNVLKWRNIMWRFSENFHILSE